MECPSCRYKGVVVLEGTEVFIDDSKNFMVYCPECRAFYPIKQDLALGVQ